MFMPVISNLKQLFKEESYGKKRRKEGGFVPLNEYPKFKLQSSSKLKELSKEIRKALKVYKKKQEVK